MIVSGHKIPDLLCRMLTDGSLSRPVGSWPLREPRDCYGHHLETELGEVHATQGAMERATQKLPAGFPPEEALEPDDFASEPGHIPYITDFRDIIEFAIAGDGSPFCLDYRNSTAEPSIIWWDDVYWRRLARSFDDFISLFDLTDP
jgi:hypothetical protein